MPSVRRTLNSVIDSIKYYYQRGQRPSRIYSQIRQRYPGVSNRNIERGIQLSKQIAEATRRFNISGPNRNLIDIRFPSESRRYRFLEVGVEFQFYNKDLEDYQKVYLVFHVDSTLTKGELMQKISGDIFNWIVKHYAIRNRDWKNFDDLVSNIRVKTIEGK